MDYILVKTPKIFFKTFCALLTHQDFFSKIELRHFPYSMNI